MHGGHRRKHRAWQKVRPCVWQRSLERRAARHHPRVFAVVARSGAVRHGVVSIVTKPLAVGQARIVDRLRVRGARHEGDRRGAAGDDASEQRDLSCHRSVFGSRGPDAVTEWAPRVVAPARRRRTKPRISRSVFYKRLLRAVKSPKWGTSRVRTPVIGTPHAPPPPQRPQRRPTSRRQELYFQAPGTHRRPQAPARLPLRPWRRYDALR